MQFGKYAFSCVFEDEAILPEYKGSTFRGVFGYALKKIVCALKRQTCDGCFLRSRCLYALVFEKSSQEIGKQLSCNSPVNNIDRQKSRIAASPNPYVIEPPVTEKTHFLPGDRFDFQLILFGPVNDALPYFIYAFEQVGQAGIGRKIRGRQARFSLRKVSSGPHPIYNEKDRKVEGGPFADDLHLDPSSFTGGKGMGHSVSTVDLTLALQTPLRLKFENRLQAELPFHVLVRAMLRRVSALSSAYGNGEPLLDYRGLVNRATKAAVVRNELCWFDWRRYSNRQDREMLMGGLIGNVTYRGSIEEFLPLIRFCEKTHLGKQTAFGLGKIEMIPSCSSG